jgi:unsaturated rhamnogalacturonyl hydrolase
MWLDGSYMAASFISQYTNEFNRPDWFNLVTFQLIHIYEKTVDNNIGLLYHAWDESCQQRWYDPATDRSGEFW